LTHSYRTNYGVRHTRMKRFTDAFRPSAGSSCGGSVPRVCFTLQVRRDRLAEYRRRHSAVWPEMLRALRDAGWDDYQLFLREDGLLVGTLVTHDLAAAQDAMDATEVSARWEADMAPFFEPDGRGKQQLDLVFDLDAQLMAAGEAHPDVSAPIGETP
jgi:L-rhamnose mutarotase